MQTKAETLATTEPNPALEVRYLHYRRCQHVRKNGKQCKGPALRGEPLCYAHHGQVEAQRRREEFRRSLGLPDAWKPRPIMQWAIRKLMQALIDGRIDERTAGPLLVEMREAVSRGLLKNLKPEWLRHLELL